MNARILLVEDDILLREVLEEFLSTGGYEVDVAENPNQALKMLEPGKYGLIMIDQDLKQMTGMRLLKQIRKHEKDVFCLLMTGYTGLKKVGSGIEEGTSDYIIKPFPMPELLNIIQQHI